jgi:hypothetical protein
MSCYFGLTRTAYLIDSARCGRNTWIWAVDLVRDFRLFCEAKKLIRPKALETVIESQRQAHEETLKIIDDVVSNLEKNDPAAFKELRDKTTKG